MALNASRMQRYANCAELTQNHCKSCASYWERGTATKIYNNLQDQVVQDIKSLCQQAEQVMRVLEQGLQALREAEPQLQGIAATKPYRLAYLLRQLKYDLLKGNRAEKKQFLAWLICRLCGRHSPYTETKNPLVNHAVLLSHVTRALTEATHQLRHAFDTLTPSRLPSAHVEPTVMPPSSCWPPYAAADFSLAPYRQLMRTAAALPCEAQSPPDPARILAAFSRLPRICVRAMTPGTGAAIYTWLCRQNWSAWVLQTASQDVPWFSGNHDPRLACNLPVAIPCDVTWTLDAVPEPGPCDSFEKAVQQWLVSPEVPLPGVLRDVVSSVASPMPLPSDALRVGRDMLRPLLVTAGPVPAKDWEWLRAAAARNPDYLVVAAVDSSEAMAVAPMTCGDILTVSSEALEEYQKFAHTLVTTPMANQALAMGQATHCGKWLLLPSSVRLPFKPFLASWGNDRPAPAVWRCPQPGDWPDWQQQWGGRNDQEETVAAPQEMPRTVAIPPALTHGWIGLWVDRLDKGGLEGVVAHLATSLSQRGLRVRVLCSLSGGHTADRLRAEGIPVIVFHGDEGKFANYLRTDPPLVLNSQYVHSFLHIPKTLGIKTVEVIQNVYGFFSRDQWETEINDRAPLFDHLIAVSGLAKDYYITHNTQVPPEVITVVPNTIDYHRVDMVNRLFAKACAGFPSNERDFVCVGTIEPRKNQLGVLRAFVEFCRLTPDCRARLIFAGTTLDQSYFAQFSAELAHAPLPDGCYVEHQEFRADVFTLLATADCCVVGAYLEGLSLAASEALALGRYLIYTDTGGAAELCADELGLVVPNPGGEPLRIELTTLYGQAPVPEFHARLVQAFVAFYMAPSADLSAGTRRSTFLQKLNGMTMAQEYMRVLATWAHVGPPSITRLRQTGGGVLLVNTRNLSYPNAELSLIANRAQAIHALTDCVTHVLAFQAEGLLSHRMADVVATPYFRTEAFISIPNISRLANAMVAEIMQRAWSVHIADKSMDVVVLSSWPHYLPAFRTLLPFLQEFRQRTGAKLVYDMHAAVDEAWEYGFSQQGEEGQAFFEEIVQAEEDILNAMDGVFVVSRALLSYLEERHHVTGPLRPFRIPCGVHTPFSSPAQMRQARTHWRRELGIQEHEVIFVYAGGFGPWQMLEESLAMFFHTWGEALQARLCIFTSELDAVLKHIHAMGYNESRLIVRYLLPHEVVPVLTAADVGLLFRRDNWTNRVAFPNKFSEYLAGGLFVLTTTALRDPSDLLRAGAFGLSVDDINTLSLDAVRTAIAERHADLNDYYRRTLATCHTTLSYEKNCQAFVDWMSL